MTRRKADRQWVGVSREKRPDVVCCRYKLRRVGDRIRVTCALCGPTEHAFTPHEARRLATALVSALARFETGAKRSERERVAGALRDLARKIDADRARRRRGSGARGIATK